MQELNTPMMKQYLSIKKDYQDCLVFYRMGDFYELFMEDAFTGARVLDITLTSKSNGKSGRIPMAGVPYHAVDSYLAKLVKNGYKVAICEQLSEPSKKGLVERDVVRVVTPGTVLDEKILDKKVNNYVIALIIENDRIALSAADISTGFFETSEYEFTNLEQTLKDELTRLSPVECILSPQDYNNPDLLKLLKTEKNLNIYCFHEWHTFTTSPKKHLKEHFGLSTLASFGVEKKPLALATSSVLLGYLKSTQKDKVLHIKKIHVDSHNTYMVLDKSTILNLELFSTIREHDTKGTLLESIDRTTTAMGGRLLKQWVRKPLVTKEEIGKRHDAVDALFKNVSLRNVLKEYLEKVSDVERVVSRLSVGIGNARDLVNLKISLKTITTIKHLLSHEEAELLKEVQTSLSGNIHKVIALIEKEIIDEPPIDIKSGGIIREGIDKELDKLRKIVNNSNEWILELEKKERERSGITSLKIRFNKVFGFYIEISKASVRHAPDNYIRKQTLVNGERFITPELKKHEDIILTAEERINLLEFKLFTDVLNKVLSYMTDIQNTAQSIATLDCLVSFATLAEKESYIRPKLLYSGEIRIKGGRHPVVERLLDEDKQFVPNDVTLDNIFQQLLLLTGPNMAGKSVFIRQVALIVLLNQIGSFVPAQSAHLSIVDRIFVRSGASDIITSGLSTFMVEMVETAHILHYATKNSLIVMDEIGRGTSTYDGISIAWAVAEYLVTHYKMPPKTLFATHYHELQTLENHYPKKIKNYHMAVADDKGAPVFLHTILPGGASHSFGVAVAKLAGVPEEVIEKANEILHNLENRNVENSSSVIPDPNRESIKETPTTSYELPTTSIADRLIHKELESLDISSMTPLQALNKLADLKEKIKLFSGGKEPLEID